MSALASAIRNVEDFLAPVLGRSSTNSDTTSNLLDVLGARVSDDITQSSKFDVRRKVLDDGMHLLQEVYQATSARHGDLLTRDIDLLQSTSLRRTIYGLLDLLVLEGILPFLLPGVGLPARHRPRPVLVGEPTPMASINDDQGTMCEIAAQFVAIENDKEGRLGILMRDRVLADSMAAVAQVAFRPGTSPPLAQTFRSYWRDLIANTQTTILFPLLTSLIHLATPGWLRLKLTEQLSIVPLRPHGVQQVIEFIASSYPTPPSGEKDDALQRPSQGPPLPVEALAQASKLLSAVPSTMAPESYFSQLAPQLWDLIDGKDGPEMRIAGGHIIGSGILGRKSIGAPGKVGWQIFAEPLQNHVNPPTQSPEIGVNERSLGSTPIDRPVVTETQLSIALKRLLTLVQSRPNPGLTARLLGPLLLPLWGLLNYARSSHVSEFWSLSAQRLLNAYIKLSAGVPHLMVLVANITWDGTANWTYGPGSEGGVEIRRRQSGAEPFNVISTMTLADQRVSVFLELISSGCVSDTVIGSIFLEITKKWLVPDQGLETQTLEPEADPMKALINAKLVQGMLERLQDKIASEPTQIIQLAKQILDEYAHADQAMARRQATFDTPTYAGLKHIVQQSSGAEDTSKEDPSTDLIAIVVSLLVTIVSSPDFKQIAPTKDILQRIKPSLQYLIGRPTDPLPPSLTLSAQNLITLIEDVAASGKAATSYVDPVAKDRQTLSTAQSNLASDLPPIRAEALHAIELLIKKSSPVLDVPAATVLLLSVVQSDPEDFVYLAAVRALAFLATRDPGLVSRFVVDAFLDPEEKAKGKDGLDGRLKAGEALGRIVESLAGSDDIDRPSRGAAVRLIFDAVMTVAGRRGQRKKAMEERAKKAKVADLKTREAQEAWGEEVPAQPSIDRQEDEDENKVSKEDQELLAGIIKGWKDTGLEEDIQLRTSALSILGQILETSIDTLTSEPVNTAIDLVLSTLALEVTPEKAILRRAAVLVILSLLRAMDAAYEAGEEFVVGLDAEKWADVERVLTWVADMDEDTIVKGHTREILESLEAWRMKRMLGIRVDGFDTTPRFGLEGKLQGLRVNPEASDTGGGPVKRPKIEEVG